MTAVFKLFFIFKQDQDIILAYLDVLSSIWNDFVAYGDNFN